MYPQINVQLPFYANAESLINRLYCLFDIAPAMFDFLETITDLELDDFTISPDTRRWIGEHIIDIYYALNIDLMTPRVMLGLLLCIVLYVVFRAFNRLAKNVLLQSEWHKKWFAALNWFTMTTVGRKLYPDQA
ncbi:hypothetical protein BZA77DRAFT_295464 [Pyronema omphalodes]|nr:hypothetical protein BZA77DRAFT_295464 [Pyronema omphalodes]